MRSKFLRIRPVASVVVALAFAVLARPLQAYTPEDEEVKAMINKGIAFLEIGSKTSDGYYNRLGGKCLAGMAAFKWTDNYNHPLVQAGVNACKEACKTDLVTVDNYSVGLALIFLCDVDPALNKREVEALLYTLLKRQKPHGGWGYPEQSTGDTSQHQYTVLGTWMADRRGFPVPLDVKERACNWLLRVQDPNGNFGYQGVDPGTYQRVPQGGQLMSLHVAAMGSLYVCTELLGFVNIDSKIDSPQDNNGLPAVLQKRDGKKKLGTVTDKVPGAILRQGLNDGNRYFAGNYRADIGQYQFYYMYGLERYCSFRELAEGTKDKEPKWYNDGVNYLKSTQKADGSWSKDYYGPMIETSFACLFLMRSTKITIHKIVELTGSQRGGKELPADVTDVKQDRNGKIVSAKEAPVVEDLLSMLEKQDTPLNEFLYGVPDQLELATDPSKRAQQITRLRRLAISGPFQSRLTAVTTLSRHRDLDNVPPLIFAVTDPDPHVAAAAVSGLRFISRKFDGPTVAEDATPPQKKIVAAAWKEWYLSIRPNGSLIE